MRVKAAECDWHSSNSNDGNIALSELTIRWILTAIWRLVRGPMNRAMRLTQYPRGKLMYYTDCVATIKNCSVPAMAVLIPAMWGGAAIFAAGFDNGWIVFTKLHGQLSGFHRLSDHQRNTQRSSLCRLNVFYPGKWGNARFGFIARHHKSQCWRTRVSDLWQSLVEDDRQVTGTYMRLIKEDPWNSINSGAHNGYWSELMNFVLGKQSYLNQIEDRVYVRFSGKRLTTRTLYYQRKITLGALSTLTWRQKSDWAQSKFALRGGVSAEVSG